MSNTCTTIVHIYGDANSIEKLVNAYKKVYEASKEKWGIGIFDMCNEIGIQTKGYDCRANIYSFEYDEKGFSSADICIESAWTPPYFFMAALDDSEWFPNMGVSFMAEELGCGIYETNDIEYFDESKFYLCAECCDEPYFATKEDMDNYIMENELEEDDYSYYELEEVDIYWNH